MAVWGTWLMSAYLVVMNRGRGKAWRDLVLVLGLIVVWAVTVAFSIQELRSNGKGFDAALAESMPG